MKPVPLDTGVIVALLDRSESHIKSVLKPCVSWMGQGSRRKIDHADVCLMTSLVPPIF
jgi:hypothetical protein